ncbi:AfsR/SARP family transcriptional regulator [Planosporangium thailandense]|uniref:AfsR/SARP family transcriptional regulator n=1 Tax=Planosporangium thailandense TaxID=765197 RepID=A0ABX0XVK3_9ACTN|nr:AfsR/SARP family transcriptional regulator [Planosporangium thailandense]NJC69922.1 AfsR/SARP family transcriptional regulator [Planosporangium thailandense]
MKVGILGPLTIGSNEVTTTPSAGKVKKMLALLVLRANSTVSKHQLIEEIWEYDPPATAHTTLQTYVMQLRKILASFDGAPTYAETKKTVCTVPGGYLFRLGSHELDLEVYKRESRAGMQALSRQENELAADLLHRALARWRGAALADVPKGPLLEAHVTRMDECRLGVLEQRIEADLRLGRHQHLLGELVELTLDYPLNESLHAKLMLALYRSGQRHRALAVFQRLRSTLVAETGLEPTMNLTQLHYAVLNSEPSLNLPPHTSSASLVDQLIGSLSNAPVGVAD